MSTIPIVVAGLWSPTDPKSYFWFNDPNQTMTEKILVTRADYAAWVSPLLVSASSHSHLASDSG